MDQKKTERIANLKHEVKDLHPVLKLLLARLPGITNLEYRQGPTEMGADFVLTKRDETLGGQEYIGCIVKVGQIKQDHAEVIRQIDECDIKRKIEGGKKEIFLTELWVITTGNITSGAQEKIHYRFSNKNIKFISGEKLAHLIDQFYPEYWKDVSVEAGEYLRSVTARANELSDAGQTIAAGNSIDYIPQTLQRIITKRSLQPGKSKRKKVSIFEAVEKNTYVLVEAQMGAGKSTLLAQLAKHFSDPETFNLKKTLPILISAKDLISRYEGDCETLLSESIDSIGKGKCQNFLFLIDALDELRVEGRNRVDFLNTIYDSLKHRSDISVVVTTRNLDDPTHETEVEKTYSRFKLCALTIKQVVGLVENYCRDQGITNKLSRDIDKSHLFRKLPKTPISAILLAKLLNENIQEIPSTMTELYEKYMELVIGRWDMSKGLQSQREYDVISNVIINCATIIMENSLLELPVGDAKVIFNEYVDDRNLNLDKSALFNKLIHKSEVFFYNDNKRTIKFRHRTFAEFFYAKGLNRDSRAEINEQIYDLYWSTSYFFYLGLRRDCPELLAAINKIEFTNERFEILKIFSHGSFLLAAYLTPYKVIQESVVSSFSEAARLYENITNAKVESPLKNLSNIQLLCIFTNLLSDNFSYEYFIPALENRSEDLITSPSLDERDYVELFLLDSVLITMKKDKAYDKLIQEHGKLIPTAVRIGIMEHSNDQNANSPIVKKFVKNFHKSIKRNRSLQQYLNDLYSLPSQQLAQKVESKKG